MKPKLAGSPLASLLLFASLALAAKAAPAAPSLSLATPANGEAPSFFAPDCGAAPAQAPPDQPFAAAAAFYCGNCSPAVACRGLNVGTPCFGIQKTCQPLIECGGSEAPNALRCICSSITP